MNAGSAVVIAATGPNICRICLTNGGGTGKQSGMESIFSTVGDYDSKSLYGILLEVCAPLGQREMLNGMPERICRGCKWRLLSAYELYETCLRSDEKMREVTGARERQQKVVIQPIQPEKKEEQVVVKQEFPEGGDQPSFMENDTTMEDYSDASALLLETQFYPEAESSLMAVVAPSPNLLEEMSPAVDHNETFFTEHYQPGENGTHKCGICEAEFPYKSSARTHIIQKHDPSKPFKCDVCFVTLTTELRLIRHKAIWHGAGVIKCDQSAEGKDEAGDTIYTCKICSKTFTSMIRFKRHKNVHVAFNRPFKCDTCLYRFQTQSQLSQHLKTHQEKPDSGADQPDQDQWPCEFCEEKLPNKRAQTMHVRRFHPEQSLAVEGASSGDKNEYKCIICSEAFARESVLNTHMKMHELLALEKEKEQRQQQLEAMLIKREQQQTVKPDVDTSTSSVANSFNETASGSGKKRSDADMVFVCIVCEQEFEEREMLLKHQKRLHKELELNIVSSAGGAQEQQDGAMEEAPVDDENDQDESMVVDLDPAEFLATENGQTKQQRGGSGTAPSLPKCELCGRTFMYNCLLQSHIKKSHSESKPFECKTCHMRFGYRGTLQKHELTHSAQNVRAGGHGSIMYKCKPCGAKFLELKSLTFHLRTHRSSSGGSTPTTLEPTTKKVEIFACSFCPQIFNAKDEFDRHLVKIHRQTPAPPPLQPAPGLNRDSPTLAARKIAERRTPMNEKEMFFDSLSIIKLENPLGTVNID